MRITDKALERMKFSETGQRKIRDDLLPGFGVIIGKRTKTFFVMYGRDRKTKTLGRYPDTSLKTARDDARKLLATPTSSFTKKTLREAILAFLEASQVRLRPSTLDRYRFSLEKLGGTLEKPTLEADDPTTLKNAKIFYNWCIEHELLDYNPLQRRKVRFVPRERLLTDEEIRAIWHYDYPPYSDIVKLLILTGQRRNQIWKFQPEWCKEGVITFPAAVMKTKREHSIPITGYGWFLQPFDFNSWSKNKRRIDQATGVTDWVLHDIRRYVSTTMASLGVPLHVTEQLIDHRTSLSGVAAIYNKYTYLDEMKAALEKYERHIHTIVA